MRLIWDCRNHQMYPVGKEGLTSGTVQMIRHICGGLAKRGHTVHVVTADLEAEEQRGPSLWYWGPQGFPTKADAVVMTMHVDPNTPFDAPTLILATFGTDPYLGPDHSWAEGVEAFPVFSKVHGDLLQEMRPTIPVEKVFLTGLGVDLDEYPYEPLTVPGRMLYCNDPARGLWHVLDIFDLVKKEVPNATLHVTYDFDRQFANRKWEHSLIAEVLWECSRRLCSTDGVVNRGCLSHQETLIEQRECDIHCYPADPPNVGTQIHGIAQMEIAAAGGALVLSDVEAFPEVFAGGALILAVIGKYVPECECRTSVYDYADTVIDLMRDRQWRNLLAQDGRALAERNTWEHVVDNWENMLKVLKGEPALV